jgi:hypothetical protein
MDSAHSPELFDVINVVGVVEDGTSHGFSHIGSLGQLLHKVQAARNKAPQSMDSSLVEWCKGAAILITCSKAQAAHEEFVILSATKAGTRDLRGSIWRSWMRTGGGGGIQAQELLLIVSVSGSIVDCNEVFYTWYKYLIVGSLVLV